MSKVDHSHHKEHWNRTAYEREFTHPLDFQELQNVVNKNALILDYGCGYGRSLQELYEKGYKTLYGVDSSSKMLERGRKLYPHLNLECIEKITTPFSDNYFNVVLLFAVLTCNPNHEDQTQIIEEIYRVLKPSGIIYLSDYPIQEDSRNIERDRKYEEKYGEYGIFEVEKDVPMRHHEKIYIDALLSSFTLQTYKEIEIRTMNNNESKAFQYICKKN